VPRAKVSAISARRGLGLGGLMKREAKIIAVARAPDATAKCIKVAMQG
jgi:hypothetical protein